MFHYFNAACFSCCTFFILYSLNVVLFPYGILFMFRCFFHFSCFPRAKLFYFAFFLCCTFFLLQCLHVWIFPCCTVFKFLYYHATFFSYFTLFMLYFFHIVLFTCCTMYCISFMPHFPRVALSCVDFFRAGLKTSERLPLFHVLCKICNLEFY